MEVDKLSESGIRRVANYSPYLESLAGVANEMDLRERSNLVYLERCLHEEWALGQQVIMSWCPFENGILLVVVPHYAVAEYTTGERGQSHAEEFVKSLISGERLLTLTRLHKVARLLKVEPKYLELRKPLSASPVQLRIVEEMVKRYGISFVDNRAVALFDIVGFSLLGPFEQMTQLNSLSYSLNSAQSKMMDRNIGISFGRSTTGDGFYIWNRNTTKESNNNLYHFMHLVLADNAIARRRAVANSVPKLRAAFHVGSCYEFHQSEGLNPTVHDYIVGDVTIELARMIERAMPGQIFVGDFRMPPVDDSTGARRIDAIGFVDGAQSMLAQLNGLELSGERISSIKCYLTGERSNDGDFTVRRLVIHDKHGRSRFVFNAKVNIYREAAEPILLGIEDRTLRSVGGPFEQYDLIRRTDGPAEPATNLTA